MRQIEIPSFLAHLKVDGRGYPIPFFVGYIDGKPDFRLLDAKKQVICFEQKLCSVCGKKLFKDSLFFISGPQGLSNAISTDPGMHRDCAEYSMKFCPHLYFEKSERRETGEVYQLAKMNTDQAVIVAKPNELFVIKADKYWKVPNPQGGGFYIGYRVIKAERYIYKNGTLEKQ